MFVRNRTRYKASLTHGNVSDAMAIATIVVEAALRVGDRGALTLDREREPAPTDPPDTSRHALWNEVSVTVSGTVYGPARAPFITPVSLRVGDELRRVVVFGDRRWERSLGGALEASDPAPFESIPLGFNLAFGGKYQVPPGPHPLTGLPHPGGEAAYPQNPDGRGFYGDAESAEGSPLPNIELPDQLLKQWDDRAEPAGFSPCPTLIALRFSEDFIWRATGLRPGSPPPESPILLAGYAPVAMLRAIHHAPGRLIFPSIAPGIPIEVTGVGRRPLRFAIPDVPAEVVTASGDKPTSRTGPPLRHELRSVHIDADGGHVLLAYGYTTTYRRDFAPEWLRVLPPRAPG
jgi:hypothetical protein